jgi:hypothetical protein
MPFCPYCDYQIPLADAKFCPSCGRAIEPGVLSHQPQNPTVQPVSQANTVPPNDLMKTGERWTLLPGEQIEWEKDFKEGLIHRHVDRAYVITNRRVVAIDIVNQTVAASLPLWQTDLVVMNRHTSSTSTGAGTYHGGFDSSVRTGTSRTVGTLVFITNGIERIRLGEIGDPDGVKNLFVSLKRTASD